MNDQKEEAGDGDNSLITWKKWAERRRQQTKLLGEKTGRPPVDLAMNHLEKVREEKERKTVLENAQKICTKPKIRGNQWEQPLRLPQYCYCEPVYEVHRTPEDMGKPPVIEYIGVPKSIQAREKGLTGVTQKTELPILNAEYKKYKEKREEELKNKIKKIDPYRPNLEDFMVKGSKPKPPPKKPPPLPTIVMTAPCYPHGEVLSGVIALRINDTVIVKNDNSKDLKTIIDMKYQKWNNNCSSWSYYFNVPVKRAGRAKLHLENLGTVSIRYCWKKKREQLPFIPESIYEQVFFFNKNEDIIPPGQSRSVQFTFIAEQARIYSETWELCPTNVSLFDEQPNKLYVNLHGDSVELINVMNKKIDKLQEKIYRKSTFNMVRGIIIGMINKAVMVEPEMYPYKDFLLEREIFLMKNPVCFYHQTEVEKMKETFTEMEPDKEWDLSINTWRDAMMTKEFDQRMQYYDTLKKNHSELLKPWYEGEGVLQQKYRAMKILFSQLADKFDEEHFRISNPSGTNGNGTTSEVQLNIGGKNIFYLIMYQHLCDTIEHCAGILSSIDLNRWIDFDFCKW